MGVARVRPEAANAFTNAPDKSDSPVYKIFFTVNLFTRGCAWVFMGREAEKKTCMFFLGGGCSTRFTPPSIQLNNWRMDLGLCQQFQLEDVEQGAARGQYPTGPWRLRISLNWIWRVGAEPDGGGAAENGAE